MLGPSISTDAINQRFIRFLCPILPQFLKWHHELKQNKKTQNQSQDQMEISKSQASAQTYILISIFSLTLLSRVSSLSINLDDKECVAENVIYDGDTISGNFVVIDHDIFWSSDHPGIDFNIVAPGGKVLHALKGTSGDKFELRAPRSGSYQFCFINPSSTPETVSFYVHVGHIPNEIDMAMDEHFNPINVMIAELREGLESIKIEQNYLKARDERHRRTNEGTRLRVIYYTLGEYFLLMAVSGLQVAYIRRLFGKSVAYNRV